MPDVEVAGFSSGLQPPSWGCHLAGRWLSYTPHRHMELGHMPNAQLCLPAKQTQAHQRGPLGTWPRDWELEITEAPGPEALFREYLFTFASFLTKTFWLCRPSYPMMELTLSPRTDSSNKLGVKDVQGKAFKSLWSNLYVSSSSSSSLSFIQGLTWPAYYPGH